MPLIDAAKLAGFFQRLSRREKIILYLSITVVLAVVVDQLVVRPIHQSVQSVDQKIHDMEAHIKRSIQLLSQKEQMMKEAEHYATYAVSSKSAEDEILVLLKQVQELASQASVNLLYSKPGGGETKERNVHRVSLECEGQMDQVINFFFAIENSKLLLRIEKYSLQPTAKGSSVVKCAATVSMFGIP
jgi:cell division protein FtsL